MADKAAAFPASQASQVSGSVGQFTSPLPRYLERQLVGTYRKEPSYL